MLAGIWRKTTSDSGWISVLRANADHRLGWSWNMLIEPEALLGASDAILLDCRFSLQDVNAGRVAYETGHIPGAHYLALDSDLSGPVLQHGGRHPLPSAREFASRLTALGVGPTTPVVAYDDSRFAFASRLWWMMRAIGYRPPTLLNGGYSAWLAAGGKPETRVPTADTVPIAEHVEFAGICGIDDLAGLQAAGAVLVDSREAARYQGLEEPIDPIAGHIPGALNRPWQGVTGDKGAIVSESLLREHWGDVLEKESLVVYCGSGVTACVNLFSLAMLGRDDAVLYPGSWSDWCSYLGQ
jgi:thiosulfate/3-mercaptopyruvate sulfurtransferase